MIAITGALARPGPAGPASIRAITPAAGATPQIAKPSGVREPKVWAKPITLIQMMVAQTAPSVRPVSQNAMPR